VRAGGAGARESGSLAHPAQVGATGFYARAGFSKERPEFEEAGIRHMEMTRRLRVAGPAR
jgi:predicted GNAT family N-acyltransferase